MSDYIKREDAYSACCYETPECYMARKEIKALPSADVVEVVRCGDCLFCQMELGEGADEPWCDVHNTTVGAEAFCSWGKEKIMADYIKRGERSRTFTEIADALNDLVSELNDKIVELIKSQSADVVEVVRCKDCKHWTEWENGAGSCQRSDSVMWVGTDFNDFCSFAERKDNGRTD